MAERNRWNLYYRGRAFCYYPDSLWNDGFNSVNYVQFFGEVTDRGERPCSAMGNGLRGTNGGAARFRDIRFSGGTPRGGFLEIAGRDDDRFYDEELISGGVRYGGPRAEGC